MNDTDKHLPISATRLAIGLVILRLSVAIVFAVWTLDKFVNPAHTAAVFKAFYGVDGLSESLALCFGLLQLTALIAFIVGYKRTISYATVLLMHAISTVVSAGRYIDPWAGSNLLFFAAFPMLAACIALFILRKHDLFSVDAWHASTGTDND